jgi:hypothetical protein
MIKIPEVFIIVKGISSNKLFWNSKSNKSGLYPTLPEVLFTNKLAILTIFGLCYLTKESKVCIVLPVSIIS